MEPVTSVVTPKPQIQTPPVGNPSTPQSPSLQQLQVIYAGFWRRWLAFFIDGLLSYLLSFVIGVIFGFVAVSSGTQIISIASAKLIASVISYTVVIIYYVYFIGSKGQTLGKMAMKIKVVKLGTNNPPGYLLAFLREVVGKIISLSVLDLGFLWMIWDHQKQTWHDKIAGTIVVKI